MIPPRFTPRNLIKSAGEAMGGGLTADAIYVDDPRDLWPHVARAIEFWQSLGIGPELVFIENVGGSTDGLLDRLVPDLQQLGYGVASGIYSAKETGSTHRRDRTFTLGLADAAPAKQERSMAWAERQSGAGLNDCLPRLADASALGSALGSARLSREHSRPGDDLGATDGTEGRLRESRGACDGLDDTAPDRRDKRPVDDSTRRASENTPRREPGLVSFYPPGKNDDDGWARRLWELGPFSAPVVLLPPSRGWTGDSEAAEPNVRGFVDGLASGLGYRRQAIECIGNGVSPETVALAFLSLIGNHICGRTAGRAV